MAWDSAGSTVVWEMPLSRRAQCTLRATAYRDVTSFAT